MAFWNSKNSGGNGGSNGVDDTTPTAIFEGISTKFDALKFANYMAEIFFEKVLTDLAPNIIADDRLINSFYGNYAVPNKYNGLFYYLVDRYVNYGSPLYLKMNMEGGVIYYEKANYVPIQANVDTQDDIVAIDFSTISSIRDITNAIYIYLYSVLDSMAVATKMSNHPILKIKDLTGNDSGNIMDVVAQTSAKIGDDLQKARSILHMSSESALENYVTDLSVYQYPMDTIYSLISHTTGFPKSYVSGAFVGSLNTTGEGDDIATERALNNYFIKYLKPILDRISSKLLGQKVSYNQGTAKNIEKVKAFSDIMLSIEGSELLTQEEKIAIKNLFFNNQTKK